MKDYIPRYKFDIDAINRLKGSSFDDVKPDVAALLEWMQDLHWGVGQDIGTYLAPHVNEIKNDLCHILNTNDDQWKFGIMICLIKISPNKLDDELILALKRIAEQPTKGEQIEELDGLAREIILNNEELS